MKIFTVVTKSHEGLLYTFLLALQSQTKLEPVILYNNNNGGCIGTNEWATVIDFKIQQVIKSIKENLNQIIIWSDVDIVFLNKNAERIIEESMQDKDICCMADNYIGSVLNGGFIAIRCSQKTLQLWNNIALFPKYTEKTYEQYALNSLVKDSEIRYSVFPLTFWCDHINENCIKPHGKLFQLENDINLVWYEDTVIFHASARGEVSNKEIILKKVIQLANIS
jgi:hypothetical protein